MQDEVARRRHQHTKARHAGRRSEDSVPEHRGARALATPARFACMQSAMAVPPRATTPEEEQEDDGDDGFTFPTPPMLGAGGGRGRDFLLHLAPPPCAASASSSPPVWLLSSSSSPIRRSFSAADCAASPWRDRVLLARHRRLNGGCSPALSDYAARAGFCDEGGEEEEETMDSLWEDLNDDDAAAAARGEDLLFGRSIDVSRRQSVAAATAAEGMRDQLGGDGAVLGASRSSRRRRPGLVAMMHALRKMFVAHKGKSRVHRDEQSTASASAASAYSFSRKG